MNLKMITLCLTAIISTSCGQVETSNMRKTIEANEIKKVDGEDGLYAQKNQFVSSRTNNDFTAELSSVYAWNRFFYARQYPDVAAHCGVDLNKKLTHQGGELYCSDSHESGCRKSRCLANHYRDHGARECRSSDYNFNPQNYLNRYPDLRAAFGNDCKRVAQHYYEFGFDEGRSGN